MGFRKPHFPLEAPRKYYDLYDPQTFNLSVSSQPPQNVPSTALSNWGSIRAFQDLPDGETPISDLKALELIHAYAASVSFIDAQIGRILQRVNVLGLNENTVILFCGDHGHHLGEHGIVGKDSLFEVSLRSPLIVSVPGQTNLGTETDVLVELVDIYPTLCDVCQLPIRQELEGLSLMPVIQHPSRVWKTAAFSEIREGSARGRSIRTERYRYTEWGSNARLGRELYDYDAAPDETVNIADLPENAELVRHLREQLRAGWQGALPNMQEQIPISPETVPWDINGDGIIDSEDLILVSTHFGELAPAHPKVDVNNDGIVDIVDLLLVALHFGESSSAAAPAADPRLRPEHLESVEEWLAAARLADDGSTLFQHGITALEQLIDTTVPTKTVLLPNYPNPFNPETWIPYDLAEGTDVCIDIYNSTGKRVKRLSIGFQTAGTYRIPARAGYWDGRNAAGEPVASGIYFYTLQAGQIKTTRQMVILK